MKVELINPFLIAGEQVLTQLVGGEVDRGQLAARSAVFTTQSISIAVGVSGAVRGQAIYGMSQVTATKYASAMMGNQLIAFDEMAVSALSELGNIISGNAIRLLSEAGFSCDITPPTVIQGLNVKIATHVPALVIPLYTKCGRLDVNVALYLAEDAPQDGTHVAGRDLRYAAAK